MKAGFKYFLYYIGLYLVGAIVFMFPGMIVELIANGGNIDFDHMGWGSSIMILGSQLVPLYIFWKNKWCDFTFFKDQDYKKLVLWMLLGWLGCVMVRTCLQQYLPSFGFEKELLESMEGLFENPVGIICVCLLAPVIEETVFRGTVERKMLQTNLNPWWAIVVSALLFAVFHGNLAQGVLAFILGLFMGWVFYCTRNIWLCILVHAVNNTTATVLSLVFADSDMMNSDPTFPLPESILAIAVGIVLMTFAGYLTRKTVGDNVPVLAGDHEDNLSMQGAGMTPPPLPDAGMVPPSLPTEPVAAEPDATLPDAADKANQQPDDADVPE